MDPQVAEKLARAISEFLRDLSANLTDEIRKSSIPFLKGGSYSRFASPADINILFPCGALVSYEDELLKASDFMSQLNPKDRTLVPPTQKYVAKRKYTIVGHDEDMKKAAFEMIGRDESDSGVLIELTSQFDGVATSLTIYPWGEQVLASVDQDFQPMVQRRASRDHPWQAVTK